MAPRKKTEGKKPTADEIKAKADKAEAKAKTAKKASTTTATKAKTGINDDQERALFLDYLQKLPALLKARKDAVDAINIFHKQAKSEGFLKVDFETALAMQGADGEKRRKAAIARDLTIARWLGLDLGAQLDLFVQDERVPAADRSFEEGKSQAMLGISLKCDYAPDTEQYRKFAEGWHAGQDILAKGFKPLHPEVAKDEADKAEKKAAREAEQAKDAAAFDAPASGVAMTRKEYAAQQAAQKPN